MTDIQDPQNTPDEIDDLLDHLVIRAGDGPNGSGGEVRYWKGGEDAPAKAKLTALITAARINEVKKLWGHAREHTITDIEMIMHQTQGKVDFIEAVDTKYFEERIATLTNDKIEGEQ